MLTHLTSFGGNLLTAGQIAGQITAHAVTGRIVSSIGGGKFGHGFFSAGMTKGLGTPLSDHFNQGVISGTVTQMVIGGTASVISGGKFANGARTAAYQALFNYFSNVAKDMAKTLRAASDHQDKVRLVQSLSVDKFGDRQALAMLYCSSGLDNPGCSSFSKIVGSALDASRYKMEILANLNVVVAQTMGVSIGNVAQSYYQDAFFGIAIGRLSIVFQELSVTFREWDKMIGTHCKVDEITDGGRCL